MMQERTYFSDYLLIVLFLALISAAFFQQATGIVPPIPNSENRKLADKPVFNVNLLDPFPAAYETYYNDHFAFRNHFISWYSYISFNVFDKSPYPDKVIIGKENQLYLVTNELDTYQGKILFDEAELEKIRTEFRFRKQYFAEKGIDYYMVICPTKYSVYPEFLPWYIKPVSKVNRTDQFVQVLQDLDIAVIDLRKPLREAKNSRSDQLYWPTDNHWSEMGAFLSYQAIVQQLRAKHPELVVKQTSDYTITPYVRDGGNLATMINMEDKLADSRFKFRPLFENRTSQISPCPYPIPEKMDPKDYYHGYEMAADTVLPRIMIVHDSFGKVMYPFLKDAFSHTVFIWDKWQYKLNETIVDEEKPDIYLTMTLESLLPGLVEHIDSRN